MQFIDTMKYYIKNSKTSLTYPADPPLKPTNNSAICSFKHDVFNSTFYYLKTLCVITDRRNYTEARIFCQRNGMQLYDIKEHAGSDSMTELVAFMNETWPVQNGNVLYVKGRKDLTCRNVNRTGGDFEEEFDSCDLLMPSICQFINSTSNPFLF